MSQMDKRSLLLVHLANFKDIIIKFNVMFQFCFPLKALLARVFCSHIRSNFIFACLLCKCPFWFWGNFCFYTGLGFESLNFSSPFEDTTYFQLAYSFGLLTLAWELEQTIKHCLRSPPDLIKIRQTQEDNISHIPGFNKYSCYILWSSLCCISLTVTFTMSLGYFKPIANHISYLGTGAVGESVRPYDCKI